MSQGPVDYMIYPHNFTSPEQQRGAVHFSVQGDPDSEFSVREWAEQYFGVSMPGLVVPQDGLWYSVVGNWDGQGWTWYVSRADHQGGSITW